MRPWPITWKAGNINRQGIGQQHRFGESIVVGTAVVIVILTYLFFMSGGSWTHFQDSTAYYDGLATAFRKGRLDLDMQPPAVLLNLPDPYDPVQRNADPSIRSFTDSVWDMSFYRGKIYLYFGPAPAVLLAMVKVFYTQQIGDQVLVLIFMCGAIIFQTLFLSRIWRRMHNEVPLWALWAAIFTAGLILPTLWLLVSPRIYSAAIAGSQFFLIGGLYFAYSALENNRRRTTFLWIASVLWSFGIGTRLSILGEVLFLAVTVATMLFILGTRDGKRSTMSTTLAALGIPLAITLLTLGWYNTVRFGSPIETGLRYQLTWTNLNRNRQQLVSSKYVFPNLYNYILSPVKTVPSFPFINARSPTFPPFLDPSQFSNYHAEDLAGLLVGAPFLLFALLPIADFLQRHFTGTKKSVGITQQADPRLYDWVCVGLLGASVISILTVSCYFYIAMRYLADFTLTLSLLAILGFWQGLALYPDSAAKRTLYSIGGQGLAAWSVGMSILLASSVSNPFLH